MNLPQLQKLQGRLTVDLLFQGSKSEGLYPILTCADGKQYRVSVQKIPMRLAAQKLSPWAGKEIELEGAIDDLRGHLRLVLKANFSVETFGDELPFDSNPAPEMTQ
jgi:hypothetical protein